MANFGINLDLRLNGQSAVDRAIRGAKALEDIVKRINNKPLNLANLGGAARLQGLGDARKKVIALAEAINKGEKSVGKTEAAIRETLAAFSELARNTEKGTGNFKEFTAVVAKAEKELEEIARASENAKRASMGLLSVEEEQAELARKAAVKKAKDDEVKARRDNMRAADKEARSLKKSNKEKEREANLQRRKRKQKFTDITAGVGFPLLTGGGPTAVFGGLIGGAFGGLGGSVLGSALGQQLDKLGGAALRTADIFSKLSDNLGELEKRLGRGRGDGFGGTALFVAGQGFEAQALEALRSRFDEVYGKGAAAKFDELAKVSKELNGIFGEIGVELQLLMAGPLGGLLKLLKSAKPDTAKNRARDRLGRDYSELDALVLKANKGPLTLQENERMSLLMQQRTLDRLIVTGNAQGAPTGTTGSIEDARNKILTQARDVEDQRTKIVRSQLTARRDVLATLRGSLEVTKAQNEYDRISANLAAEKKAKNINAQKIAELELEQAKAKGALDRAQAEKANQELLARRAIKKEQLASAASRIQDLNQITAKELQFLQIQDGRFNYYKDELEQLERNRDVKELTLDLEKESRLLGVVEKERISAINNEYKIKLKLLERDYDLQVQAAKNAKIAYDVGRLQVRQALEMEAVQARINAQRQIQSTSPFANESFLMDPFFGQSRQLQSSQILSYTSNLELLNAQLDNVRERMQLAAPGAFALRQQLEDQERSILNQIENFEKYQPAIDNAALAQSRFNEALAITTPVTDSLFSSLMAVVDGTQTAQEAFANFLRNISDMLMQAAQQMIATYIAIGIARSFAGMKGSGDTQAPNVDAITKYSGITSTSYVPQMALGGQVSGNRPYLVGERGPELFVPGAQGNIVSNDAMGGANVTVNVDASGSQVQGDGNNASQLGKAIGAAVQAELIKQQRPGGLLAR